MYEDPNVRCVTEGGREEEEIGELKYMPNCRWVRVDGNSKRQSVVARITLNVLKSILGDILIEKRKKKKKKGVRMNEDWIIAEMVKEVVEIICFFLI